MTGAIGSACELFRRSRGPTGPVCRVETVFLTATRHPRSVTGALTWGNHSNVFDFTIKIHFFTQLFLIEFEDVYYILFLVEKKRNIH